MKQFRAILTVFLAFLAGAHAVVISINTSSGTGGGGWNSAVWGAGLSVPTAGNDYVMDASFAANDWLWALGGSGIFAGDSLTVQFGADLFLNSSGDVGTLILDGGRVQIRSGGIPDAVVTGSIRVDSASDLFNINKNMEFQTAFSGFGDLNIIGYLTSGNKMTFSGADAGYSGTFRLNNTAADNVTLTVQFNQNYPQAGLSFIGGNILRAPVYQLVNDITFKSISMPSASDPSVLVNLAPGTYNAAALNAAGIHSAYFNDLGGTISVKSTQYLSVHGVYYSVSQAYVDEIIDRTGGSTGTEDRRLAHAYTLSYLNGSIESTQAILENILQLSEANDLPVIVHLDGIQWWEQRSDLWNWWDPTMSGYDPNNVNNVEWFDWGSTNAVKIGWRNWGRQLRVKPKPNLASPIVLNEHLAMLNILVPVIVDWYDALPEGKKELLAGVVLGWETSTYSSANYYTNGNSYLNLDPANDPHFNQQDSIPMGYAAATTLGLQADRSIPITEETRTAVVTYYHEQVVAVALTNGLPSWKIVTHAFEGYEHSGEGALVDGIVPGWSAYGKTPEHFDPLLDQINGGPWAAIEFQPTGLTEDFLASFLEYRNCRYVNVFNWASIRDNATTLDAYNALLSSSKLSGDLIFSDVAVGQLDFRTLNVHNNGTSSMTVSSIDYPVGFSGSWLSGEILPGGVQSVTVTFEPLSSQSHGGTIMVHSDALGNPHRRTCSVSASASPGALVLLADLVKTYDGTGQIPSVSTDPSGLPVQMTYDGSASPPVEVGVYEVVAQVNGGFTGRDTRMMTILSPNGVPREWFDQYGLTPGAGETWADVEQWILPGKQMRVWEEYIAGVDPLDSNETFQIVFSTLEEDGAVDLMWMGGIHGSEKPYAVQLSTNLMAGWFNLAEQDRMPGVNQWTGGLSGVVAEEVSHFFRVLAEADPVESWTNPEPVRELIPINLSPSSGQNVDWNSAVWGDSSLAPVDGKHYITDERHAWIRALGGYGGFDGSSMTLKFPAPLFISGGGDLGGTLILDGGQVQNRAGLHAVITGNIQIISSSQILNINGNIELQTGLSGLGDLKVGGYLATGQKAILKGVDLGYTGDFVLSNSGSDNVGFAVQFDIDYPSAGLTFQGGNALRAPVYQLVNDISFARVSMPAASNPSVLITLGPGTYNAATLAWLGVHSGYYNDLGGTITVLP